jgi:hypothetical protein
MTLYRKKKKLNQAVLQVAKMKKKKKKKNKLRERFIKDVTAHLSLKL